MMITIDTFARRHHHNTRKMVSKAVIVSRSIGGNTVLAANTQWSETGRPKFNFDNHYILQFSEGLFAYHCLNN